MSRARHIVVPLLATTAVLILLPVLRTGWFGDDASYANLASAIDTGRISLVDAAWASYSSWLATNGRWYPGLVIEKYAAFAIFENRVAYKAAIVVTSLVALAVAGRFFARLWSVQFAFVAILWTISCFQIRGYHDPFLAYNGMIEAVAIAVFLSLSTFLEFVETGKRRFLVASLCLYVVSCSIYEIAYIFAPLYVLTAWSRRPWRASLAAAAPFAAIGAALIAFVSVLRARAHVSASSSYSIHFDPGAYIRALFDQVGAALPLSYLLMNPSKIFLPPWLGFAIHFNPIIFAVACACAYVTLANPLPRLSAARLRIAVAFAAALVLLPAVEIPALLKYQIELTPGLGYLPVFIEYFGFGLFAAVFFAGVMQTPALRWTAIALFATIATLTAGANAKTADILEVPYLTSRDGFERALSAGLFTDVPEGANVAIAPEFPWVCRDGACIDNLNTSDVVAHLSSKHVKITSLAIATYVATRDARSGAWTVSRAGTRP